MRKEKEFDKVMRLIKKSIDKLIATRKLEGKEIVLFGVATRGTQQLIDYLFEKNISITAIIDNTPSKSKFTVSGIPIYMPQSYLADRRKNVAVLVYSLFYFEEQMSQLEEIGYVRNEDYFFVLEKFKKNIPLFARESREVRYILSGYLLYKKIMRNHNKDCKMLLLPYEGSGDTYLIGMYLKQYIEKENLKNYVVVANGNLVKKVLDLFSVETDKVINMVQKNKLLTAYQFLGTEIMNVKVLLFWGWRVRRHINVWRENAFITFDDDIKYSVLGLDEAIKGKQPQFETSSDDIKQAFEKHGLKKGKSVILAPYMGADIGVRIPFVLWERLSEALITRGYCVFTNCSSSNEIPVKGTKPVFFPLKDMVPILNEAGYFIGLRSGLCDVISTSACKMIVLYVSVTNAIPLYYFGLKRIGLNGNAIEVEYMDNVNELLNKILENFKDV